MPSEAGPTLQDQTPTTPPGVSGAARPSVLHL